MTIDELIKGQKAVILAKIGDDTMEFETSIEDTNPKRRLILTNVVTKDEKTINFSGSGIFISLLIQPEKAAPQIFKNVKITLVKDKSNKLLYEIKALSDAVIQNRRQHFRVYLGANVVIQCGANHSTEDAILKDISASGFSITMDKEKAEFNEGQIIHTVFSDSIENDPKTYTFNLYGIIIRKTELDNRKIVYGCKFNSKVVGLDTYIMQKERLRIQRTRGK